MSSVDDSSRSGPQSRLAVVVIHGMGEQEPMETLRGFAHAVWEEDARLFEGLRKDKNFNPCHAWSEPDDLSGSMELRRVTTRGTRNPKNPGPDHLGVRADFFELHWADLTTDTTWGDFLQWLKRLLLRRPRNVPPRLLFMWVLLWLLVASIAVSTAASPLPKFLETMGLDASWLRNFFSWPYWAWVAAAALSVGGIVKGFLTSYFGDVARYVSAAPRNIKVRKEARERGLKLISEITNSRCETNDQKYKYDRIVIVGHSLGSILAHDLVWLAWNEISKAPFLEGSVAHQAVQACERAGEELLRAAGAYESDVGILGDGEKDYVARPKLRKPEFPEKLSAYRRAQSDLFRALASGVDLKKRWLISDIVTLGSPLTHASVLIARSAKDLETKLSLREALRCPLLDNDEDENHYRFSYQLPTQPGETRSRWQLHHGSAMGPVRWTNIHDAAGPLAFMFGDLISGPLSYIAKSPNFGPGVVDVKVEIRRTGVLSRLGLSRLFTHTLYWALPPKPAEEDRAPAQVLALRDAINVLNTDAAETQLLARAKLSG